MVSHTVGSSAANAAAAADVAPRTMMVTNQKDIESEGSIQASLKRVRHMLCTEDSSTDDDDIVIEHLRHSQSSTLDARQPNDVANTFIMEYADDGDEGGVEAAEENGYQDSMDDDDGLTVPQIQRPSFKSNRNAPKKYHMQAVHSSMPVARFDVGECNVICRYCGAYHWKLEAVKRSGNGEFRCCGIKGK